MRALFIAVFATTLAAPSRADAESVGEADWHYLIDGGAVPFVYGSGLLALSLRLFVEPPERPKFFDESEGGEGFDGDTVPELVVTAYAAGGALAVGLIPADDSRLFHLKGFAQAVLTTVALTETAKAAIGRRRPHFSPDDDDPDVRRSFFSGHSSVWFSTSTYLALYLNGQVFSRWRDDDDFAFWTFVPAGLLLGSGVFVAATRLDDNRHHLSDVVTGAAVGAATSVIFYAYQEHRYRRAKSALGGGDDSLINSVQLVPWTKDPGATLVVTY